MSREGLVEVLFAVNRQTLDDTERLNSTQVVNLSPTAIYQISEKVRRSLVKCKLNVQSIDHLLFVRSEVNLYSIG